MPIPFAVIAAAAGAIARVAAQQAAKKAAETAAKRAAQRLAQRAAQRAATQAVQQAAKRTIDRGRQRFLNKLKDPKRACKKCKGKRLCNALFGKGNPAGNGKYRGGSWNHLKGGKTQAHHMPASAASKLKHRDGPVIQMDINDHQQTASHPKMPGYLNYQSSQRSAIGAKKFMQAFAMDVLDIKAKFGSKYDEAIVEASAYAACLKHQGVVE